MRNGIRWKSKGLLTDEVSILAGGALDEDDALFVAYATEFVGRSMVAD